MIYTVTLNPARDRTVVIDNFSAGKVNRIQSLRDDPGGKGINVSKMIRSLGGKSVAMGILGGATGKYIKKSLQDMGIDSDFVLTTAETRTNIKVVDTVRGETTDINEPGTPVAKRVLTSVFTRLKARAQKGDIVVFAGKIPQGASAGLLAEWIGKLTAAGVRVFLDADGDTLFEGVKASPYLIKPNEAELSQLMGCSFSTLSDVCLGAKRVIHEAGVQVVAVSMGGDGALIVTKDGAYRAEGIRVPVLSTVGAGDAMMAALAFGMDTGMPFPEMVALSIAASAACVSESGTQAAPLDNIMKLKKLVKVHLYKSE